MFGRGHEDRDEKGRGQEEKHGTKSIISTRRSRHRARADHDFAIRGIIFDIDKEFYHVDWGQWGKKPVPINWVENLQPWRLIYRYGDTTP